MSEKLTVGELVYKISGDMDNLKAEVKRADTEIKNLKTTMEKTTKTSGAFTDSFRKLAGVLGLAFLTAKLVQFGKASLQAYANAQQSAIQFNNAQQNVSGSTKEQIDSLNDYINALEQKTTVDDKSIRQGAQILAQDQIAIENQKKLLKGIVDIAVANSKANGGEVDVAGTAKAVGRVIATGDAGILTRQNILLDPKTAKLIKETGDQAERTALVMKVLEENGKGAGDALGASFQGSVNRAKDTVEDLQVAIGKGLAVALTVLGNGLSDTVGGFGITTDGGNKFGVAMVVISGAINAVINTIKIIGIALTGLGVNFFNQAKIVVAYAKDVVGAYAQIGKTIKVVAKAFVQALSGDFEKASETLEGAFDFSGVFDNTKKALDESKASVESYTAQLAQATKDLAANGNTMLNAGEIYAQVSAQQDALTLATDSAREATVAQTEATEEQLAAMKKAEEVSESYKDKLLSVLETVKDKIKSINEDLAESFKKFSEDTNSNVEESTKGLAEIFLGAQAKVKELKKELADVDSSAEGAGQQKKDIKEQIKEQEAIIKARKDFEERQAETIAGIRARLESAGIDAAQAGLDKLITVRSLETEIAEQRRVASLDEFTRFEEEQTKKLLALTDQFIAETVILQNKVAQEKALEADVTAFLIDEDQKRLINTEAWANATLVKYGEMAASLRNLISLQSKISGFKSAPITLPAALPKNASTIGQSSTINNNKNISAPISISATLQGGSDLKTMGNEIAWQIGQR